MIDPALIEAAAIPHCLEVAQAIAADTAQRAKDHLYAEDVHAVATPTGAKALTNYEQADLDEFGSINNPPTAAMRSAAADHGRFVPNPKP